MQAKRVPRTRLYLRRPHLPRALDTRGASPLCLRAIGIEGPEGWYKGPGGGVCCECVGVWALPLFPPFLRCEVWGSVWGSVWGIFWGIGILGTGGARPRSLERCPKKMPQTEPQIKTLGDLGLCLGHFLGHFFLNFFRLVL